MESLPGWHWCYEEWALLRRKGLGAAVKAWGVQCLSEACVALRLSEKVQTCPRPKTCRVTGFLWGFSELLNHLAQCLHPSPGLAEGMGTGAGPQAAFESRYLSNSSAPGIFGPNYEGGRDQMHQIEQPEEELAIKGWVDHMFHWPALPQLGHLCPLNGLPTHSIYEAQPQNVPVSAKKEQEVRRAWYTDGSSWVVAHLMAVGIPPSVVPWVGTNASQQPTGRGNSVWLVTHEPWSDRWAVLRGLMRHQACAPGPGTTYWHLQWGSYAGGEERCPQGGPWRPMGTGTCTIERGRKGPGLARPLLLTSRQSIPSPANTVYTAWAGSRAAAASAGRPKAVISQFKSL